MYAVYIVARQRLLWTWIIITVQKQNNNKTAIYNNANALRFSLKMIVTFDTQCSGKAVMIIADGNMILYSFKLRFFLLTEIT